MSFANHSEGRPPAILTIAGTDSSGGAGIQADLKTFTALGCYGTSAVTALTAQNTTGVQAVHPAPPEFVEQQIRSVLDDVDIQAIKTGMLFDADNTHAVANTLQTYYTHSIMPPLVCDPVCVSTTGHTLLHPHAIEIMIRELFPLTMLITPNKSEAELLLSHRNFPYKIVTLEDMLAAAKNLTTLGPQAVLLKGGHITVTSEDVQRVSQSHARVSIGQDETLSENMEILQNAERDPSTLQLVVDVLYECEDKATLFLRPRIDSANTHGTGCTLSAALACGLGRGLSLSEAIKSATAYTHLGIETASKIGKGNGPLNHLHSFVHRIVPLRTSGNPHPLTRLLIQKNAKIWKDYVEHDFVKLLGKGTLPRSSFVHFIKQDYHYLKYYARAHGLLAAKSPSYAANQSSAQITLHIVRESVLHKTFCAQWDISEDELENTIESQATMAYGGYLIDIGLQGDDTKLIVALSSCLLGYGEVGLWLKKEAAKPDSWVKLDGNPYLKWIEDYSGEDYQAAVRRGLETIEARVAADPPSAARFEGWREVWEKATRLEIGFWDMAMRLL